MATLTFKNVPEKPYKLLKKSAIFTAAVINLTDEFLHAAKNWCRP